MNFIAKILGKILGSLAVFFAGKQHEKASQAKKISKSALEEAKRHASTPLTSVDAVHRLRERANRKR